MNWLHTHVQGLSDRREARKYATAMLHAGLIRHTVNKSTFSEQCYYTLGELVTNPGTLYTAITLLGTVWVPNRWGIPTGGNFKSFSGIKSTDWQTQAVRIYWSFSRFS